MSSDKDSGAAVERLSQFGVLIGVCSVVAALLGGKAPRLKDPRDRIPTENDFALGGSATALEAVRHFFPSLDEPRAQGIAQKLFAQPRTARALLLAVQADAPDLFEQEPS